MLLWLTNLLSEHFHFLRVFQYLTFRSIVSTLTALLLLLFFSPRLIRFLVSLQIGQVIRELGPKDHYKKAGTPTMGGILMIFAIVVSVLLWGDLTNRYVWVLLLVTVAFSMIGLVDDYRKVIRKNTQGLPARWKF